jgi:hypothetical protein
VTREELRARARRAAVETAAAQGLPAKVTDPGALAKVAALMKAPAQTAEPTEAAS